MGLRRSELMAALELEHSLGVGFDRRRPPYHPLVVGSKEVNTGPSAGPFEEREDENGYITYHLIKK